MELPECFKANTIIPRPEQLISANELVKLTQLTYNFWAQRRYSGDGPPFIRLSAKCVRYRWGDVVEWLDKRKCTSTSTPYPGI